MKTKQLDAFPPEINDKSSLVFRKLVEISHANSLNFNLIALKILNILYFTFKKKCLPVRIATDFMIPIAIAWKFYLSCSSYSIL